VLHQRQRQRWTVRKGEERYLFTDGRREFRDLCNRAVFDWSGRMIEQPAKRKYDRR